MDVLKLFEQSNNFNSDITARIFSPREYGVSQLIQYEVTMSQGLNLWERRILCYFVY